MFRSAKIKFITAREILDSRGNPTVEAEVTLNSGLKAKASVPSGVSTGIHEAHELRDKNKKRYRGLGVSKACINVNKKIAGLLRNQKVTEQRKLDGLMIHLDATKNKSRLGANAILAVSLACARAGSLITRMPLYEYIRQVFNVQCSMARPEQSRRVNVPTPMFNIFNGGKHADTNLDFQEFMIIPIKNLKFAEKVRMGAEIFHMLGDVLKSKGYDTDIGNEGGYAPNIRSSVSAIEFIIEAIKKAGYKPGVDVGLGTDVGASELYSKKEKKYIFKLDNSKLNASALIELYSDWTRKYPFISIEDGLAEDDWQNWGILTGELGKDINLIGDDLFATNVKRLEKGIKQKAANSILIKPNQAGTLSETIDCIKLAKKANYKTIVSHRSGETCDDFIADLAVAVNADYIKAGSLSRGERLAKYNRLMEIEQEITLSKI
ncbi:phosphopyruvate hydratase [Candidatus Falkowbacteria bacterium]|nr:phosphopyruvate hydratase [Candidatus Falkowbacteria bacterium]